MGSTARLGRTRLLGALALAGWSAHAEALLLREAPHSLLWCCNLGALLLGLGLVANRPTIAGVGLLWVALGTPIWLIALSLGREFLPTSLLTHLGALAAGLAAERAALPTGAWKAAWTGLAGLHFLSHAVLGPEPSVNLSGTALRTSPWAHAALIALCAAAAALLLPLLERGLRAAAQALASSTASRAASTGSSTARTPSS